jgi:DNA-binding CsgD family transcriptional regulator
LVVSGEPGVGKTALLEYVVDNASGCRVARAMGVQSEMQIAFAGLHQFLAPMLDRLERLPAPQLEALRTVFGVCPGSPPDRFLVALAVLTLLSDVAEERPLICVVDDEQWLDRASAQALAFVARRLAEDSVGLVFAARTPSEDLAGLPELELDGLPDADARALLDSALTGPLDARIRDRIVSETRGNPLALLELPRAATPAELAGGFGRLDAMPLAQSIEESFRSRLGALPAETRRLMALAASDPVGEPALLWRAAERLAIGSVAAAPAVDAGLLELGALVRFRHPLVRSVAYGSASLEDTQEMHRALAEATDPQLDPDRRAWHRAQAAEGPDEEVADELERSAGRAQARGGLAAAAAFLERAAALTVEPARRRERALAAAQAKQQAGAPDAALVLLAVAEQGPLGEFQRAQVGLLRAQIAFAVNRGSDAPALLLQAAKQLESLDVRQARETYLEALSAAQFAGRLARGGGVLEAAEAARAAPAPAPPLRAVDLLLDGLAALLAAGYAAGAPTLKLALQAFRSEDIPGDEALRWTWLACRTAIDLWDYDTWDVLSTRLVELTRDAGALAALPLALTLRMGLHLYAGDLGAVASLTAEVEALTEATASQLAPYGALLLAAWQGREAGASEVIEATIAEVVPRGEALGLTAAQWATAVLYNGLGRYQDALRAAEQASERAEDLGFSNWSLVELVEAAARCGKPEAAADALERLTQTTRPSGTGWALGIEARSRALLSEGETAESLYREAIDRLDRARVRAELARAHLLYGEWLRREHRRQDARRQLHTAHEMLGTMGFEAFAERARRELLATGETVRKRVFGTRDELTPQETQIARLARDGLSNPEIGARLFISPRTVKYHLQKVFTKLEINSRSQLARRLPQGESDSWPSDGCAPARPE